MEYVLGFDGGGTKTELIVTDLNGTELLTDRGGASNPKSLPFDSAMRHLTDMLDALHGKAAYLPQQCRGICIGMAGIYMEEEKRRVHEHLARYYTSQGWPAPLISIMNDAEIALMAGVGDTQGMIAIAGTGSIVYGLTPSGNKYRTGGWGHLLGDHGSGYDIGLQTLQAIMLSYDGVLEPTLLTELVLAAYGFESPADLRSYIYEPHIDKQHVAKFAELCIQAAEAGDSAARDIIGRAASGLADLTEAMLRKDEAFRRLPIAVTGSIFRHSPLFGERYREQLKARGIELEVVSSERKPAYGAALLAVREWNNKSNSL
ncbi:N-acetylglucosamine kinase [Paenibacillus rigui]|uniref:N-acetylglucosamine kinase n=1 Tax=Paenibacillus rigui TaxID=554312 RepID=UPI0015C634FD|nr:BadF/BadG/BcrA/BcrD ATPase family protein [Paenibacillus rigui]